MRDVCVIDIETTGLDPMRHEITEISAIRVTGNLKHELDRYHARIRMRRPWTADSAALQLNGYREQLWEAEGQPLRQVLEQLIAPMSRCIVAGHCVAFDISFLRSAYTELWLRPISIDRRTLDTSSLAYPLLVRGQVPDLRLQTLLEYHGIDPGRAHTAGDDCRATLELLRRLCGVEVRS